MITNTNHSSLEALLREDPAVASPEQLHKVADTARRQKVRLFDAVISAGFLPEEDLLAVIGERLGLERVELAKVVADPTVLGLIPAQFAQSFICFPTGLADSQLSIAVRDPTDLDLLDTLRLMLTTHKGPSVTAIHFVLASTSEIHAAIKQHYGLGADAAERLVAEAGGRQAISIREQGAKELTEEAATPEASVIKFVNLLLIEAVKDRATDIHIEPLQQALRVRYRIDGMLHEVATPPSMRNFMTSVVSRVKIMADLDIAEKRLPQDGRFQIRVAGKEYDLRVSILPTPHGEAINIRILTRGTSLLGLEQLGMAPADMPLVEKLINRPNGVILVTGPTGSGKTTFLYACLSRINEIHRKIVTIEDPIEYRMDGVIQMQVASKIGFVFARALRSMLRHDPDVMMIGEIRDTETAQTTIRSALTGHLVFSTLHTNDAAGAIARLLDMEIEPFLCASSLLAVLAIRLVRVLCPHCKEPSSVSPEDLQEMGLPQQRSSKTSIYTSRGCSRCRGTGFSGRTGIFEILAVNEEIRDMIHRREPTGKIKQCARSRGMKTLRQDGCRQVLEGTTTINEVLRVCHTDELTDWRP